ncbi:hypothetical protein Tco_0590887 [Tanacetum coccineum]
MTTSNNNGTERAHDPQSYQNNEVGVPRRSTNSHRKEYKSQFQTLGTEVTISQGVDHLQVSYPQTVFTNEWDLASLEYSQETEGPYSIDLPTPADIRQLLELERVMVDHTIKSQTITLTPNQILTKELSPDIKQWEELIRENVFRIGGHRDHLPACLAHMLYCVVAEEQYNLAYFYNTSYFRASVGKHHGKVLAYSEHSMVTYTSVSEDDLDMGSPGIEVPIFEVPPSPDYIPGPEGPPSPDYVPGPEEPEQAPPSPIYVPFVPEPVYPYFLPEER